ncbi:MAG: hypothetical protein NZM35_06210 [Chitinophagales bacterium]|nr:hypothetical protein [Chitinophagales bacterium]MDW8418779.1 transketolase C-terminal domain-containing protein [Chitinophagales bacterium]
MRTAFIHQLLEEARANPAIFLLVGDLGYSVVEPFAEAFPDRFLNVGIAEQNMTGIAAGLAMEGYNVFTYSIGNFPTLRCMEQIRYDVCYHELSVKIVAVGGGYAYGPLGASHHTTEDIAMLRSIPNMRVCAPGDPAETKAATAYFAHTQGPGYLRLGKAGEPLVHTNAITDITKLQKVMDGEETAVLTTGGVLALAKNHIQSHQLKWGLYSVPFIKPIDFSGIGDVCRTYHTIYTIEEHQRFAGFGSAVLETINELYRQKHIQSFPQVCCIGIEDLFVSFAGSQEYLREMAGVKLP